MFGFSFGELLVISLVALVAVGPQKLPGMLKTLGQYVRKIRQMTQDVRQQTGIDEMLRAEGIQLNELRSLLRGAQLNHSPANAASQAAAPAPKAAWQDPYDDIVPDVTREYPPEGADSYGALPDDLFDAPPLAEPQATAGAQTAPEAAPSATAVPENHG